MTDLQREALAVLAETWRLAPDVRIGQLMAHLDFMSQAHLGKGLGYVEDDELVAILYRHRAELEGRLDGTTSEALSAASDRAADTSIPASPTAPKSTTMAKR